MEDIVVWFAEYGYFVLGFGLFMEFLFLPFPGGTVMGFSGVLAYQGDLIYIVNILFAGIGTSLGMSATYLIGYKLGAPFFEKHGSKFFLGPKRRQAVQKWYDRFGNKVVFVSFFIPGVRHFTGYFSGIMRLSFPTFIIYTVGGAFAWATTFVSFGYFLGPRWENILHATYPYLLPVSILAVIIAGIYFYYKFMRVRKP
ncbi:DedA family protein [Ornithinibacillus gellani]|uniref:DedA family protein n=1 Tax=Ornithinibacillus gellani TaxID=2293253 RepID=UPI000F45FD36|nr:DedA family protein [Ornithinibacillus gellani]TQS76305.1 DedA family protein [Ornithinibacillus gellani]